MHGAEYRVISKEKAVSFKSFLTVHRNILSEMTMINNNDHFNAVVLNAPEMNECLFVISDE